MERKLEVCSGSVCAMPDGQGAGVVGQVGGAGSMRVDGEK